MFAATRNLNVLAARLGRATTAPARAWSSGLDFVPLDLSVDPLDESARSALAKSCYVRIQWKIGRKKTVAEAIKLMSAHNIGALAVTDDSGTICGIVSERDYLNKVGVLGKSSKELLVESIATMGAANLKSVTLDNPIDKAQNKMIASDVRHLFVRENGAQRNDTSKFVGLISIKDIVKCTIQKNNAVIGQLHGFLVNKEQMKGL